MSFYRTFATVLFGFAAYVSIQWLAEQLCGPGLKWHHWFLFSGTMVSVLHFWLVCISSNEIEDKVYCLSDAARPSRIFNALFIVSVVLSLSLVCPVVIMARSLYLDTAIFWWAYLSLSIGSLGYDVFALLIVALAVANRVVEKETKTLRLYVRLYGGWLTQDVCFVVLTVSFLVLKVVHGVSHATLAVPFALVVLLGITVDVVLVHPHVYTKEQITL